MNDLICFKKTIFSVVLTVFLIVSVTAQTPKSTTPRQDILLNKLKVLVWSDPTAEKVTIKLRIHSGSVFDPKDKMGVMALLVESLFPTDQAKAFFSEDLEGSLDLSSNYDYLQITATGKTSELLSMLETLSNAVINPQISPESFKTVRAARLAKVRELENDPSYLADRAVSARLLGEYPYGRSKEGTLESLSKIDFADLLFAKQRFLTSDNATIAIIGNVRTDFVFRATRQLFGGWVKSDKKVPPTFEMPNEPDPNPQLINISGVRAENSNAGQIRFATRGVARNDDDYFAVRFLLDLWQSRLRSQEPDEKKSGISVSHERNLLPGVLVFRFPNQLTPEGEIIARPINLKAILKQPISSSEFEETRTKILSEIDRKSMADKMLDIDTFGLVSYRDEFKKLNSVTLPQIQAVADKLTKQTFVQVTLNSAVVH